MNTCPRLVGIVDRTVNVPSYVQELVSPFSQFIVIVFGVQADELDEPVGAEYPLSQTPVIPWVVVSLNEYVPPAQYEFAGHTTQPSLFAGI